MDNLLIKGDKFCLIDFSACSSFIENGQHIERQESFSFNGNLLFATLTQLALISTTRRDDVISLGYVLAHLLNQEQLTSTNIEQMRCKRKKQKNMKYLCYGKAECL
jgi:hypothetical protein